MQRDWGMQKIMFKLCGKSCRIKPKDYVVATGKQYSVKEFVNQVLKELKVPLKWEGKGINSKCYDKKAANV